MPYASNRGIRLYYETAGNPAGPPLLLVRGLARSSRYWLKFLDAVAPRFRVLMFDNRGVGRSDAPLPWPPYTTSGMAEDTVAVMDHAGFARANVFGISLGGMISMQLALRHAARVDRLVIGCTTAGGRGAARIPLRVIAKLLGASRYPLGEAMRRTAEIVVSDAFARDNPEVIDRWCAIATEEPGRKAGLFGQLFAGALHDVSAHVGRISQQTMVITGDADRLIPPANSKALAARIPGARFEVLAGAGHDFPTERPREVAALLEDFLCP